MKYFEPQAQQGQAGSGRILRNKDTKRRARRANAATTTPQRNAASNASL